jgi:hypothetical protein
VTSFFMLAVRWPLGLHLAIRAMLASSSPPAQVFECLLKRD